MAHLFQQCSLAGDEAESGPNPFGAGLLVRSDLDRGALDPLPENERLIDEAADDAIGTHSHDSISRPEDDLLGRECVDEKVEHGSRNLSRLHLGPELEKEGLHVVRNRLPSLLCSNPPYHRIERLEQPAASSDLQGFALSFGEALSLLCLGYAVRSGGATACARTRSVKRTGFDVDRDTDVLIAVGH